MGRIPNTLHLLLIVLALLVVPAAATAQNRAPKDAVVQTGRAEWTGSGWQVAWAGAAWRAAFAGTAVGIETKGGAYYAVIIDGIERTPIAPAPDGSIAWYRDLTPGLHEIEVVRRTGGTDPIELFGGFVLDGPGARWLPAPKPRALQILFIGDSSMTGFGTLSDTSQCSSEDVVRTSDATRSYPVLTARLLDADWDMVAVPGGGLTKNCCGGEPYPTIVERLFSVLPKDLSKAQPRPAIAVVGLGNVDAIFKRRNADGWRALGGDERFTQDYLGLMQHLRRQLGPSALIVAVEPNRPDPGIVGGVGSAVETLRAKGDRRIVIIRRISDEGGRGCYSHADVAQNRAIAERLASFIRTNF